MPMLVASPEDRFSRIAVQITYELLSQYSVNLQNPLIINPCSAEPFITGGKPRNYQEIVLT